MRDTDNDSIAAKADSVYRRISRAALKAGRNPGDVALIAVTKTVDIGRIKEAINAGLRVFGESRVQEAQRKIAECGMLSAGCGIKWHLIGHLQKNKVGRAVQLFDLIHSLDSVELAEEINRQSEKTGKIQDVLVEVKLSQEETKYGVPKEGLIDLLKSAGSLKSLNIKGLMCIPAFFAGTEDARPSFRELRGLRDRAVAMGFNLPELSMGMSHDFEVAIEEGATMVRIGTAIFGGRR